MYVDIHMFFWIKNTLNNDNILFLNMVMFVYLYVWMFFLYKHIVWSIIHICINIFCVKFINNIIIVNFRWIKY